jgi:pimeloyl-ACP methyl ester carboxylesterase
MVKNLRWCLLCAFLLLPLSVHMAGCGAPGLSRDALTKGKTQVLMDWAAGGKFTDKTFFNYPYPSDDRLTAENRPNLDGFPVAAPAQKCSLPPTKDPFVSGLIGSVNPVAYIRNIVKITKTQTRGFSINPSVYFRFSSALDASTLPSRNTSLDLRSSVFLINIDPKSPEQGKRYPILINPSYESRFLPGPTVVVRPSEGFPLKANTTYAVVFTTDVRDNDGWPLVANAKLTELATSKPFADADKERRRKIYAPMFAYLKSKFKLEASKVAATSVFTTGDPLADQALIAKAIKNDLPAPKPPIDMKCSDSTLYVYCYGKYESPMFQDGKAPFLDEETGFFRIKNGKPEYKMTEIRFALTVPKVYFRSGAVKDQKLPMVMYAHGTGGSYRTFVNNGTAAKLARMGIAVFGIDQAVNGDRTISLAGTKLDFLFFNALNLPAARDNVRQSALDYHWQARFLLAQKLKVKEKTFVVNPKKLWFMGHSQGGLTGPVFLAFDNKVSAAYLSAPGGYLVPSLLYKTKPVDPIKIPDVINYLLCDKQGSVTVDHPVLSLLQHFFDPADPMNYAPRILSSKRTPINLFMTEGLTDEFAAPQVFEPLAIAMRLPMLGPVHQKVPGLHTSSLPFFKLPVSGNFVHPSGKKVTVGFTQHPECKIGNSTCDGHFVAFYNPNALRNWQTFFHSLTTSDIATVH